MWEDGARDLSVYEMVDKALGLVKAAAIPGRTARARLTTGEDTLLVAILSHETTALACSSGATTG